ncbi:MAG: peptidoglycan DD-metalloendopeptidase family protein [Arenicellales bacterium]
MIRLNRSPDNGYLAHNDKSHTRNVFKLSSALGIVIVLCVLSIWAFTPISEEVHYKLDSAPTANSISDSFPNSLSGLSALAAMPKLDLDPGSALTPQMHAAPTDARLFENQVASLSPETSVPALALKSPNLADSAKDDSNNETNILPVTQTKAPIGHVKTFTIKSGDTLTRIFKQAQLSLSQAINLANTKAADQLKRLRPKHDLRIFFDAQDQWETLEYDIDKFNTLIITPNEGKFDISTHTKEVEYRQFTANGVIHSDLFSSANAVGLSINMAAELVNIYKWEIDFARDIRKGNRFSVVYEKAYIDGEFIDDRHILAASFTLGGRTIDALRYTDSKGITAYFQPDGASLKRGFLRTPMKVARVTSSFGKRKHPIKKVWKAHKGVDYGAKRGTPIVSTADGVVQYAGTKGGYGRTVILRHGGIYTTLYAHMSKIGKGIRSGKAVKQNQVIGYVGHTGWATGDHVHYEFRINGKHKNPVKVKLPKTLPLAKKEMKAFKQQSESLQLALAALTGTRLAAVAGPKSKQNSL